MNAVWTWPANPLLVQSLPQAGVLLSFEGLLSLYGSELWMWQDHVVAIEDLQNVKYKLMPATTWKSQVSLENHYL